MRTGLTISTTAHALLLAWGLISFADPTPLEISDAVPVDVISEEQFSQMTQGQKQAEKQPAPKPVAEKVDTPKPQVEDLSPKVAEQEVRAPQAAPPPPPEPRPPEPQRTPPPIPTRAPDPRPRDPDPPKPEPKPEPKVDQIAEALKREEQKKPEPPKPEPPKPPTQAPPQRPQPVAQPTPPRPAQPAQPDALSLAASRLAALNDRRDPSRTATTGAQVNRTASLGTATGNAARLTQTEIDALRAQIQACWNPPIATQDAQSLIVRVKILLNQDGSLAAEPILMNRGSAPTFQIAAEGAMRAVRRCAPYRLPAAKYDAWKDVEITFDPRDMLRG